jgi:quercetin dioxygenase-like cupin family protein
MSGQAKRNSKKTEAASEFYFERQTGEKSPHFSLAKISEGAALFAVLRGSLTVIIDGEGRTLSEGEMALVPRHSVY